MDKKKRSLRLRYIDKADFVTKSETIEIDNIVIWLSKFTWSKCRKSVTWRVEFPRGDAVKPLNATEVTIPTNITPSKSKPASNVVNIVVKINLLRSPRLNSRKLLKNRESLVFFQRFRVENTISIPPSKFLSNSLILDCA